MRRSPCPDCGVVMQSHMTGCMTAAVERGDMTARERQIKLYEHLERIGATVVTLPGDTTTFAEAFRSAIRASALTRVGKERVVYAHPSAIERLRDELLPNQPGWTGHNPDAPLRIEGIEVKQNDLIPSGSLIALPKAAHERMQGRISWGFDFGSVGGPKVTQTFYDDADAVIGLTRDDLRNRNFRSAEDQARLYQRYRSSGAHGVIRNLMP